MGMPERRSGRWRLGLILAAVAVFAAAAGLLLSGGVGPDESAAEPGGASGAAAAVPEKADRRAIEGGPGAGKPPPAEPLDILRFRLARGYYRSGGNAAQSTHPYSNMALSALESLAAQDDGLAQLVLADRIENANPEQAAELYRRAAFNGKTAGLVHLASSRLVVRPGNPGFGLETPDSRGRLTRPYVEVLKFYAAAEILGDFIGTGLLCDHLSSVGLVGDPGAVSRVCERGMEVVLDILEERQRKWGRAAVEPHGAKSIELPEPVCSDGSAGARLNP